MTLTWPAEKLALASMMVEMAPLSQLKPTTVSIDPRTTVSERAGGSGSGRGAGP